MEGEFRMREHHYYVTYMAEDCGRLMVGSTTARMDWAMESMDDINAICDTILQANPDLDKLVIINWKRLQ